jgi:hypothetical protein
LTTDFVLSQFSSRNSTAREAFRDFVTGRCNEKHRPEFHGNGVKILDSRVIGTDDFLQRVLGNEPTAMRACTIVDILKAAQEICGVTEEEMLSPGQGFKISESRALAAWGVLSSPCVTLKELGEVLRRDASSLCSAAKRLEARSKNDDKVAAKIAAMRTTRDNFTTLQS